MFSMVRSPPWRPLLRRAASAAPSSSATTRRARPFGSSSSSASSSSSSSASGGSRGEDEARLLREVLNKISVDKQFIRTVFEKGDASVRQNLLRPLATQVGRELDKEFRRADVDGNQQLSAVELRNWYTQRYPSFDAGSSAGSSAAAPASASAPAAVSAAVSAPEPSRQQLLQLSVMAGIPFIGFGILDNAIMLTAGNQIEASMGVALGMSPLMAAGFGNLISDVAGLKAGGLIEAMAARMGLPDPGLTAEQLKLSSVKRVSLLAGAVGIAVGCVIGLFPLLFIDEQKNKLRDVFESIDSDHSGSISEDELLSALKLLGVKRDTVHQLMKDADIDGSEDIDFDEFCRLYERWKADFKSHS
jgi:hypothetical protein